MQDRLYKFTWDFIGDIQKGRPNLGQLVPIEIYRMFQYTLRDVLEEALGTEEADLMLYKAGYLGGKEFYAKYLHPCDSLEDFIGKAKNVLTDKLMSIIRVEAADDKKLEFTIAVSEDLDCSGLPELSHGVCNYDEGFLAGLLEAYAKIPFDVKEIDCWCTGDRVCRFDIRPSKK